MGKSKNIDMLAVLAKTDRTLFEDMLREYKPFILSIVQGVVPETISEHDDIAIIGINAFYEAVQAYTPVKGEFFPFASLVIKRRVADYMHGSQDPPQLTLDAINNDDAQTPLVLYEQQDREQALREEIAELTRALSLHGISMNDVYKGSPRRRAGREAARAAVAEILKREEYLNALLEDDAMIVCKMAKDIKMPQKKLEASKGYILACALVAAGGFPLLKEYLYPEVNG